MSKVKAKKQLGQHFLNNQSIAQRIVDSLDPQLSNYVLEIGPGMGVLTQFLLQNNNYQTSVIEIDTESVAYLQEHFPQLDDRILGEDFLKFDISAHFDNKVSVIGNFPYNISSQILFRVLDYKDQVPQVVGMFQREVAQRIASPPGNKSYGILSVLLQAYYDIQYLFTVDENEFTPPPKVKSGVIALQRNSVNKLDCDEKLFFRIVKTCFNQRRKTIRNSIKPILKDQKIDDDLLNKRPEQLDVAQFVILTNLVSQLI